MNSSLGHTGRTGGVNVRCDIAEFGLRHCIIKCLGEFFMIGSAQSHEFLKGYTQGVITRLTSNGDDFLQLRAICFQVQQTVPPLFSF